MFRRRSRSPIYPPSLPFSPSKPHQVVSNLRNQNGVDYAPWMQISATDEAKIRQIVKEKAEARRKRKLQEQEVQGTLFLDSQAQELSGLGLKTKVRNGRACVAH